MARNGLFTALACAALLGSAPSAFADAYGDGKDLYDQRNFAGALGKFQQAAQERPTEAKIQWMLGLTYLKLRNGQGALAAFESAQRLDPRVSFTKPQKFSERLARARAMTGMGAVAARPVTPRLAPPPVGVAPTGFAPAAGGVQFFREPVVNQAARDMVQNRRWVRDYGGLIQPGDLARLEALVNDAGQRGADLRIIALPRVQTPLPNLVERVWQLIKASDRDVLVVASPQGANARCAKVRRNDMQRILLDSQKDFLVSVGQGLYAVGAKIAAVYGLKAERVASKKRIWIWVLVGVGGLILLIIIIAVVKSNQRKAAEAAEYKASYDKSVDVMGGVADKLTDLQLSVKIIDDEDARMLTRRGEASYFAAQGVLQKLPSPGKGDPDQAGARRLAGMLEEATQALDKAERIVSRLTNGKPVDKEKLLAEGGKKLGCYFCSRPMRAESDGHIVGIELKGQKMDVLSCDNCHGEYSRGQMPKVRMVEYEGRPMHWSMVPAYDPWYDYYHYDRYRATWVDAVVLATIFDWAFWHSHPSPYVMWYPPGAYMYSTPAPYFNVDTYSRDRDVDAVIGGAWDQGGTPSGISFAGVEGGGADYGAGAGYGGAPEAAGGRDVS